MTLEELLLAVHPYAYISGSWARGEETEYSDIDLFVPEKHWKTVKNLIPKPWDSCIVGHIGLHIEGVQIEFSYLFPRYRKYKERTIYGVTFRC